MRQHGRIVKWQQEKGFGFIEPTRGGDQLFVHIKAMPGRRAPAVGTEVSYRTSRDSQGRANAEDVKLNAASLQFGSVGKALLASGLFFAAVAILAMLGKLPLLVLWLYLGVSLTTGLVYWWDKQAAKTGGQRTPENSLHLLALAGGWPGALIAQQALRHKSIKQPFRTVFWLTLMLNIAGLGYLLTDSGAQLLSTLNLPFLTTTDAVSQ